MEAMTDIKERAELVRKITEGAFGRVVSRDGDIMTIEIPADIAIGLAATWGRINIGVVNVGQTTRLAPRRIVGDSGHLFEIKEQPVTTAFYILSIDLAKRPNKSVA